MKAKSLKLQTNRGDKGDKWLCIESTSVHLQLGILEGDYILFLEFMV